MEKVKESASYDNYLDTDNRIQDDYKATLDKYVGEELTTALPDKVLTREEKQVCIKFYMCIFVMSMIWQNTAL